MPQSPAYITQQELEAILLGLKIGLALVGVLLTAILGLLGLLWHTFNSKFDALATKVDQAAAHDERINTNTDEISKLREHHHDLANKQNKSFAMLTALETWRTEHSRFAETAESRLEDRIKAIEERVRDHERKEGS